MSMREGVKFCGIMSEQDIAKASAAGARAVGVIVEFDPKPYNILNPDGHSISVEKAAGLVSGTPDHMDFVLVPNTGDYNEIVAMTEAIEPDRVQIGKIEDPKITAKLSRRYEGEIDLAQIIHVGMDTDVRAVEPFIGYADFIHLDTADDRRAGGTGRTHDWSISRVIAEYVHGEDGALILAGGLSADNVAEAIATVQPDGVDAESANRKLDVYNQKMMMDFVDAAA